MSQRASGYERRRDEEYPTPNWVAGIMAAYLRGRAYHVWEPAAGHPELAKTLRGFGFEVRATSTDFMEWTTLPAPRIDAIVTNPPYGADRGSRLAVEFIQHALSLDVRFVMMLLRVDFDSAKGRVHLFRDNPTFSKKIILLDRIKWFEGPSQPSDNHALFVWDSLHHGPATISYAARSGDAFHSSWEEMWSKPFTYPDENPMP